MVQCWEYLPCRTSHSLFIQLHACVLNQLLLTRHNLSVFSVPAQFTFTVQHTNISTAEAYNVTVVFYFTRFLNFSSVEYCNISQTLQTTPQVQIDNSALQRVKFTVCIRTKLSTSCLCYRSCTIKILLHTRLFVEETVQNAHTSSYISLSIDPPSVCITMASHLV